MFVILLTYKKPFPEVEKHLPAHREFLDRHYAAGRFVCSGPQEPREGGIILCRAENRGAVEALTLEDPFHIYGVADYLIIEFVPTHYCDGFEAFL